MLISITTIGTLLEWAEYTFYGYLALKLSSLFFPAQDALIATIKTYAIFAIGYVMRPLGAILFGYIGDHFGRKPALSISMILMGLATLLIGCLPIYAQWGIAAPICLLILRMLQGIAVSGEFNGAGIFLTEKIGSQNPCLAGSWVSSAAAFGMVLGGLAAFIVSLPSMPTWAWRVPFIMGGMSCFVGLWLRHGLSESSVYLKQKNTQKVPTLSLLQLCKSYKQSFYYVAAIAAFTGIYVYILNIYIVAFLSQIIGLPTHHATFFAMFGETTVCLFIPLLAWVADRWQAERQYQLSLLVIAATTPLLFMLMLSGSYMNIGLAMLLYGFLNGLMCGPIVKLLVDRFPITVRYTGISFAWSLSAAVFSGTAPMVAQYLSNTQNWQMGPAYYVSFTALVVFFIIQLTKITQDKTNSTTNTITGIYNKA